MSFAAPAEHYDRFMGRYTRSLAPQLAEFAGVAPGMRALDVGCGPGGLSVVLADLVGGDQVAAIDPAEQFVAACRARVPGADVRVGPAEALPWADATFDIALACLVIRFMTDPDQGVREMARVTRPGGRIAACMWDIDGGGMTMLRLFWSAVHAVRPDVQGEALGAGTARGDIAARLTRLGLTDVADGELVAHADYAGFDDFWEPLSYGVGPAGAALAALSPEERAAVAAACRAELPAGGAFMLDARAWVACGTVA
jgi:SAM-dependent methyltransferase